MNWALGKDRNGVRGASKHGADRMSVVGPRALAVLFLVAVSVVLGAREGRAYEGEHYAWTYYVALHMGFTERQAFQIASATYAIDWDSDTGPMPHGGWEIYEVLKTHADEKTLRTKWRQFHAFASAESLRRHAEGDPRGVIEGEKSVYEDRLWRLAVDQENPGPYLHFRQDRYSHGGWADVTGHGAAGHLPDYFWTDPDMAWQMTESTISDLLRFRREVCKTQPKTYCKVPPRDPDRARLREVLRRLSEVNKPPRPIQDPRRLIADLKELSLQHPNSWIPSRGWGGPARAVTAVARAESIYVSHGFLNGFHDFAKGDEGPRLDRTVDVIRQAIAEDKGARERSRRLDYFPNYDLIDDRREFAPLPLQWIQYDFDRNAKHIGPPALFAVEDVTLQVGDPVVNYRTSGDPTKPDAVVEVSLDVPITISGMAMLPFLSRFPTAIVSTPDGVDAVTDRTNSETAVEQFGQGQAQIKRTIWRRAADLLSGTLSWPLELHVYSLEPVRLSVPLKVEPKSKSAAAAVSVQRLDEQLARSQSVRPAPTSSLTPMSIATVTPPWGCEGRPKTQPVYSFGRKGFPMGNIYRGEDGRLWTWDGGCWAWVEVQLGKPEPWGKKTLYTNSTLTFKRNPPRIKKDVSKTHEIVKH